MAKGIVFIIFIILGFASSVLAQTPLKTGEIFYQPNPNFNSSESYFDLLDNDLRSDLLRFHSQNNRRANQMTEWGSEYLPQANNSFIFRRFLDKGLKRAFQADMIRHSSLVKASEKVKEKMHTNVEFNDAVSGSHKIDFRVELFQGFTQIEYTGLTTAKLRYYMGAQRTALSFEHRLAKNSSMAIETSVSHGNSSQFVMINSRW